MKRILISALFSLCCIFCSAEDKTFRVTQLDGTTVEFRLADEPTITFSGNNIVITTRSERIEIDRYDIADCDFKNIPVPASVNAAKAESDIRLDFTSPGVIAISGRIAGKKVAIFDASGRQCAASATAGTDAVSLDISGLAHGNYIISVEGLKSIKFVK